MITAAEYRAWTEESLKWASEATTPEERHAHIRSAEIWLQCALRSERLPKQPPTTEYEWVLPPFKNGDSAKRLAGCAMIRQNQYAMLTIKMLAHARNRIWVGSIRANMGTSPVPHPTILPIIATMAELCLPTELSVCQSARQATGRLRAKDEADRGEYRQAAGAVAQVLVEAGVLAL